MARLLRMFEPHRPYFVTNRTVQGRLFLTPTPTVNRFVGGVLARALATYRVSLYSFHFASNHFHLIVSAEHGGLLSDFVGYLEANIAREVGRHIGWRGPFWERRFSAEPILDDEALRGRVVYTLSHGAKEGLVSSAEFWPGLTCIPELVRGQNRLFPWYDRSAQCEARRNGRQRDEASFASFNPIRITPLPCWRNLTTAERTVAAAELLDQANTSAAEARAGKPYIGPEAVCAQNPWSAPQHVKRTVRPLCHASTVEALARFKVLYAEFVAAFREASALLRRGNIATAFPEGAFRPRLPFAWRPSPVPLAATG